MRRLGVRRFLMLAFILGGTTTLLAAILSLISTPLAIGGLGLAAIAAVMLDVGGNLPFLRSVRPSQRTPMTAVFMTYRDFSEVGPPGLYALLLRIFPLPTIFAVSGLWLMSMAAVSRYLPRRL